MHGTGSVLRLKAIGGERTAPKAKKNGHRLGADQPPTGKSGSKLIPGFFSDRRGDWSFLTARGCSRCFCCFGSGFELELADTIP